MRSGKVKRRGSSREGLTRRDVLRAAAAAALGTVCAQNVTAQEKPATQPATTRLARPPWWMDTKAEQSRVVDIRSGQVVRASSADRVVLGEMLTHGILALTGERQAGQAWRAVLGDARRIVLKFNAVGAEIINTSNAMAHVLVTALAAAGYDRKQLELIEIADPISKSLGVRVRKGAQRGWGATIVVGGRPEPVARYVYEADAIINVPFLKTHRIAGMSGCLKNLSHAVIKHPGLYHANGCSPFVAEVVGSEAVQSRLKLNIVNAVRIVGANGPAAAEGDIIGHGGLFLGLDPVAVDAVGLELLALGRKNKGIRGNLEVPYLVAAANMGLGRSLPHEIELRIPQAGS